MPDIPTGVLNAILNTDIDEHGVIRRDGYLYIFTRRPGSADVTVVSVTTGSQEHKIVKVDESSFWQQREGP